MCKFGLVFVNMTKFSVLFWAFIAFVLLLSTPEGRRRRRRSDSTTRSCGSSGTRCTCEDRAFEVIYGLDQPYYSPRQDLYRYGPDVWCFDYIVARTEDPSSRCLGEDLNHIVMAVDPQYEGCSDITCSTYRTMVVEAGCICPCGCYPCCTTALGYDRDTGISGVKFAFMRPIQTDDDEMQIFICVRGTSDTQPGLVAYYGVGTYAYSCDHYDVPAFCQCMHAIH